MRGEISDLLIGTARGWRGKLRIGSQARWTRRRALSLRTRSSPGGFFAGRRAPLRMTDDRVRLTVEGERLLELHLQEHTP